MHRFFVSPDCIDRNSVVITGGQAHQLKEVLRLKAGNRVVILDNTGSEYQVKLVDITHDKALAEVIERHQCINEPRLEITLHQALLKSSKFDLVLQKCTEIGVTEFRPVLCQRCVSSHPSESRLNRWQRIIVEAAEQSRRGKIPNIHPVVSFERACEEARGLSLLPWEGQGITNIRAALRNLLSDDGNRKLNIFVGPEGGFSSYEVEFARTRGIVPVTLGKRILRSETAAMVAATIVLYQYGELD